MQTGKTGPLPKIDAQAIAAAQQRAAAEAARRAAEAAAKAAAAAEAAAKAAEARLGGDAMKLNSPSSLKSPGAKAELPWEAAEKPVTSHEGYMGRYDQDSQDRLDAMGSNGLLNQVGDKGLTWNKIFSGLTDQKADKGLVEGMIKGLYEKTGEGQSVERARDLCGPRGMLDTMPPEQADHIRGGLAKAPHEVYLPAGAKPEDATMKLSVSKSEVEAINKDYPVPPEENQAKREQTYAEVALMRTTVQNYEYGSDSSYSIGAPGTIGVNDGDETGAMVDMRSEGAPLSKVLISAEAAGCTVYDPSKSGPGDLPGLVAGAENGVMVPVKNANGEIHVVTVSAGEDGAFVVTDLSTGKPVEPPITSAEQLSPWLATQADMQSETGSGDGDYWSGGYSEEASEYNYS